MLPFQLAGVLLAGSTLASRYTGASGKKLVLFKPSAPLKRKIYSQRKPSALEYSIRELGKALSRGNPFQEFSKRLYATDNPLKRFAKALTSGNPLYSMGIRPLSGKRYTLGKGKALENPIKALSQGLTTALTQVAKTFTGEDYDAVIKYHIPPDARLLRPQYPANANAIEFVDIDGDSRNELITTYKHENGLRTVVLKKQKGQWAKVAEIDNPGFKALKYRGYANLKGSAKPQLLLGLGGETNSVLHGYDVEEGEALPLFSRGYDRFEVLRRPAGTNDLLNTQIAFWDKGETGAHNIEMFKWDGMKMGAHKNAATYFQSRVVPYHALRLKKAPYSPAAWYNLADALANAGMKADASTAIEMGTRLDTKSEFQGKFADLKSRLSL